MASKRIATPRTNRELYANLEAAARRQGVTLVELLNLLLREEERKRRNELACDEAEQARLQAKVKLNAGVFSSRDRHFSEGVSAKVRKILRQRQKERRL
jgi:hypothetical protein